MYLKLLKTDFKHCSHSFIGPLVGILGVGLMMSFSYIVPSSYGWLYSLCAIFLFAIAIVTVMTTIKTIRGKFISPMSYLEYSLPVKKHQHLSSHLITVSAWGILLMICGVLVSIVFIQFTTADFTYYLRVLRNTNFYLLIGITILVCIKYICLLYLCMMIPSSGFLKRYSSVSGIALFVTITIIENFIYNYWKSSIVDANFSSLTTVFNMVVYNSTPPSGWLIFQLISNIVYMGIYFLAASHLLNNYVEAD